MTPTSDERSAKPPVTESPSVAESVRAARLRQTETLESIGRLAGGIAHDFNNLLTSILGYSELLDRQLRIRGNVRAERRDLKEIRLAAERARELTQRLLAFSCSVTVQPQLIELRQVVLGMERLLRRFVSERTAIVLNVTQQSGPVLADPVQIEQMLLSLAVNACDAMPDGGTLTIAADSREINDSTPPLGTVIGTAALAHGTYVELSVTDTGRGMDADFVARVFEPFVTPDSANQHSADQHPANQHRSNQHPANQHPVNQSAGLSGVHGMVTRAGGVVIVDSRDGVGTTMRVLLPRVQNATNDALPAPVTEVPGGNESILLAEDDADVRALNVRTLREAGYEVLEAEDGNVAIEIASRPELHLDLLITDIVMPGRNGWEVAEAVQGRRPDILVLYVSGFAPTSLTPTDLPEQGVPFLAKPFTPSTLLHRVRQLIDTAPTSRE